MLQFRPLLENMENNQLVPVMVTVVVLIDEVVGHLWHRRCHELLHRQHHHALAAQTFGVLAMVVEDTVYVVAVVAKKVAPPIEVQGIAALPASPHGRCPAAAPRQDARISLSLAAQGVLVRQAELEDGELPDEPAPHAQVDATGHRTPFTLDGIPGAARQGGGGGEPR